MIVSSRSNNPVTREKELKTPMIPLLWDMLKTPAFLVDMFTDFCSTWRNIMVITMIPTFMKEVLKFDISQVI